MPMILSKERLEQLLRAEKLLLALEAGGVDNWEWYHESTKHLYQDDEEEDVHATQTPLRP